MSIIQYLSSFWNNLRFRFSGKRGESGFRIIQNLRQLPPYMFGHGTMVKLTKITKTPNSIDDPRVLPDASWVEGCIISTPVKVGYPIDISRTARSRKTAYEPERVESFGYFHTSIIQRIDARLDGKDENYFVGIITTKNSVWEIELLKDRKEKELTPGQ